MLMVSKERDGRQNGWRAEEFSGASPGLPGVPMAGT